MPPTQKYDAEDRAEPGVLQAHQHIEGEERRGQAEQDDAGRRPPVHLPGQGRAADGILPRGPVPHRDRIADPDARSRATMRARKNGVEKYSPFTCQTCFSCSSLGSGPWMKPYHGVQLAGEDADEHRDEQHRERNDGAVDVLDTRGAGPTDQPASDDMMDQHPEQRAERDIEGEDVAEEIRVDRTASRRSNAPMMSTRPEMPTTSEQVAEPTRGAFSPSGATAIRQPGRVGERRGAPLPLVMLAVASVLIPGTAGVSPAYLYQSASLRSRSFMRARRPRSRITSSPTPGSPPRIAAHADTPRSPSGPGTFTWCPYAGHRADAVGDRVEDLAVAPGPERRGVTRFAGATDSPYAPTMPKRDLAAAAAAARRRGRSRSAR